MEFVAQTVPSKLSLWQSLDPGPQEAAALKLLIRLRHSLWVSRHQYLTLDGPGCAPRNVPRTQRHRWQSGKTWEPLPSTLFKAYHLSTREGGTWRLGICPHYLHKPLWSALNERLYKIILRVLKGRSRWKTIHGTQNWKHGQCFWRAAQKEEIWVNSPLLSRLIWVLEGAT